MSMRSDIEAMDRPTILYIIYRMVIMSAQKTNLFACDGRIFPKQCHLEVYYTYIGPPSNT